MPQSVAEEMLEVVASAICDRPGERPAERNSRTRQLVHTTLAFEPRDGLEYMLSTLAFGHFHLILDSISDVFHGQTAAMKIRTKTTIVALDRSMIAFIKEWRLAGKRPLASVAADAASSAGAEAPRDDSASAPVLPNGEHDRVEAPAPKPVVPKPEIVVVPGTATAAVTETVPAIAGRAMPIPAPTTAKAPVSGPSVVVPQQTIDRSQKMPRTLAALAPEPSGPAVMSNAGASAPHETDGGSPEEHIAAFQEALVAMAETLAEASALDDAKAAAKAASAD